jgi:hypothetical protein
MTRRLQSFVALTRPPAKRASVGAAALEHVTFAAPDAAKATTIDGRILPDTGPA